MGARVRERERKNPAKTSGNCREKNPKKNNDLEADVTSMTFHFSFQRKRILFLKYRSKNEG